MYGYFDRITLFSSSKRYKAKLKYIPTKQATKYLKRQD